jgi:hypothetical protein
LSTKNKKDDSVPKHILLRDLKEAVDEAYRAKSDENDGKSLSSPTFKALVQNCLEDKGVDHTHGKGKKWYKQILTTCASEGGSSTSRKPKKKKGPYRQPLRRSSRKRRSR